MEHYRELYRRTETTLEGAIAKIQRGKHIFLGSGAATPEGLVGELVHQADRFSNNHIHHIMTLADAPYVEARYAEQFRHHAYFIGKNVRDAVNDGRADFTPIFLSQIPDLIRQRRIPVDVLLLQVSEPDEYGFVNLGVSVDVLLAAFEAASLVIAEVNPNMPAVHGAGYVQLSRIHAWVHRASELRTLPRHPLDAVHIEIGRHVAKLVDDGSTIQVGIGQLPDAVLQGLRDKHDLGVWTEMVSDGIIDLIDAGAVTGRYKTMDKGRVSATFAMGSAHTYKALHRNPHFWFHPTDVVNDPTNIGRQHKMVAINSALEVDLTGQVCADSLGGRFFSGIGGQVDFIRGASMCRGGKPIIALPSTACSGTKSRIVSTLTEGAGVVTSRGDVHYVVTEYGIADLHGKSIRDRALALVSVAHPDHRSELLDAAKARRYVFADQITPRAIYRDDYEVKRSVIRGIPTVIRPLRETDEPKLADMFYSLSEDTVRKRYLAPLVHMPHKQLMRYLVVDDELDVGLVVETHPLYGTESEIVGVGRYHTCRETNLADVAFVIRDDWQGLGYGKLLFGRLADIARENGLRGFTADVLASNRSMMRVFESQNLKVEKERDGETLSVRLLFPEDR